MSVYTVHQPPQREAGASVNPERFAFVRDGFYFWAMVFGPIWLLWRRLWLSFFLYVAAWILVEILLWALKADGSARMAVGLAFALLLGLEASSVWRWTLNRRRWKNLGVVVGDDLESAERRFFQTWQENGNGRSPSASTLKPPPLTSYGPKPADNASDVIGLFPEPGGPR